MFPRFLTAVAFFSISLTQLQSASAELPKPEEICARACNVKQIHDLNAIEKALEKALSENAKEYVDGKKDEVTFFLHDRQIRAGYKKKKDDQIANGLKTCQDSCIANKKYLRYSDCETQREINEKEGDDFYFDRIRTILADGDYSSADRSRALAEARDLDQVWRNETESMYKECLAAIDAVFVISYASPVDGSTGQQAAVAISTSPPSSSTEASIAATGQQVSGASTPVSDPNAAAVSLSATQTTGQTADSAGYPSSAGSVSNSWPPTSDATALSVSRSPTAISTQYTVSPGM